MLPLYCECSGVFSQLVYNPLLTKWIQCIQIPPQLDLWRSFFVPTHTQKREILINSQKDNNHVEYGVVHLGHQIFRHQMGCFLFDGPFLLNHFVRIVQLVERFR